jgi:hypothetical protein
LRDASPRPQHHVGAREFVGWGMHVASGVVQHQVFEGYKLAGEPKARAGVVEVQPIDHTLADWACAQPLVKSRK